MAVTRIPSLVLRYTWHYVIIRYSYGELPKFVLRCSYEAALRKGVTTALLPAIIAPTKIPPAISLATIPPAGIALAIIAQAIIAPFTIIAPCMATIYCSDDKCDQPDTL